MGDLQGPFRSHCSVTGRQGKPDFENFCRSRSNGKAIYSTMQTGPMSNWDAATFTLRPGPVLPCLSLGCKDMFCCIHTLTWTCLHLAWAARTCSAAFTL